MGWLRLVGRVMFLGSLAVAAATAGNQVLTGDHRLSWTAAYFALVFTVLGLLLDRLPARAGGGERRISRRRYLRRVRACAEQMETVGLVTQAEFVLRTRQVYVDVVLQPREVTGTMSDGGVGGAVAGPAGKRLPLASFLTRGCVLAVLGAAGSGKTTMVRYTALEMAERRWWPWQGRFWRPRRIPVLLYLRDHAQAILAEEPQNLAAIAAAAPWLEGAVTESWLRRRLDRGRCVVLLDGLDEVAGARERGVVAKWVDTQVSRYPGNSVVVTSRPLGYDSSRLARADVLQVQRFTRPQIEKFLKAWFRAIEHRARQGDSGEIDRIAARGAGDLIRRVTDVPALLDLAANPLLLTMIANVHRYGRLPGRRVDLYAEMCQVLLHRRQEAKYLAAPHPALDGLSGDAKERLVSRLAWEMMIRHQRDIPIAGAETALGALPHQSGPALTAQVFLDYARRSGLLLEHKPGHYGFAHLSLQEYLAAVHVPGDDSRRRVLIDQVSDPWWRETILLWAARNDASPIVEACLAARTVPALSLAYACADQADELDQHLRDQLTQFLTSAPSSHAEARLLDGVAADRQLHDSTRLDDGAVICATPVSHDLWNRYLRRRHSGDSRASSSASASAAVSEPVRGLWAADLPGFLDWLNGLSDDGPAYRLPAHAELAQLPAWTKTAGGTVWTYDEAGGYRLYQPEGISHPHSPTPEQLRAYPNLIIERTYLLLHLATNHELPLPRLLLYGYLASREDFSSRPKGLLIQALDLLATIDTAQVLNRTLAIVGALDRALHSDLVLALDLILDRARSLASDLDLDLDLAFDRAFDRALDLDRALAFDPFLDRVWGLNNLGLDRGLDPGASRTLNLAHALYHALAFDRGSNHASENSVAFYPNLASGRVLARGSNSASKIPVAYDRNLDRDLARDLARGSNSASEIPVALDPALSLALDRVLDRGRALDPALSLALGFSRTLAVARLLHSDRRRPEVIEAGIALLEAWIARRSHRHGKSSRSFVAFVATALADGAHAEPQDAPIEALERIKTQVDSAQMRRLLGCAQELIAPPPGGDGPAPWDNIVLAAAMVLAEILFITARPSRRGRYSAHVAPLQGVLATLIALTSPENQNQTVLLVRV